MELPFVRWLAMADGVAPSASTPETTLGDACGGVDFPTADRAALPALKSGALTNPLEAGVAPQIIHYCRQPFEP